MPVLLLACLGIGLIFYYPIALLWLLIIVAVIFIAIKLVIKMGPEEVEEKDTPTVCTKLKKIHAEYDALIEENNNNKRISEEERKQIETDIENQRALVLMDYFKNDEKEEPDWSRFN